MRYTNSSPSTPLSAGPRFQDSLATERPSVARSTNGTGRLRQRTGIHPDQSLPQRRDLANCSVGRLVLGLPPDPHVSPPGVVAQLLNHQPSVPTVPDDSERLLARQLDK